jgi:hypothetical protein
MIMAREKPIQFRLMWGMVCTMARFAPRLVARSGGFFTGLPEADQAAAREHPESSRALFAAMFESIHGGVNATGMFQLAGRYLARTIPNCHAIFFPGKGHLSLVVNHLEQFLSALPLNLIVFF